MTKMEMMKMWIVEKEIMKRKMRKNRDEDDEDDEDEDEEDEEGEKEKELIPRVFSPISRPG